MRKESSLNLDIVVLEWVCGGGMLGCSTQDIPAGLRAEGWAMLSCIVNQLSSLANCRVSTVIDRNMVRPDQLESISGCEIVDIKQPEQRDEPALDWTLNAWSSSLRNSTVGLVIAPEIDGILECCLDRLGQPPAALINCSGEFLSNCCSKLRTARRFSDAEIAHPETLTVADFLSKKSANSFGRWCIKPDLGAGCEGLQVGDRLSIEKVARNLSEPSQWLVQPWMDGDAFSCSAIVGRSKTPSWYPLVTQRFDVAESGDGTTTRIYRGGEIVSPTLMPPPIELLNRAIDALDSDNGRLGWIGIDLLKQPNGDWMVIEVNPRMTTSVIGLSRAASFNVAEQLIRVFQGDSCEVDTQRQWKGEFSPTDA